MPLLQSLREDVFEWKDTVANDFEESVFPQYPVLSELKQKLYAKGASYAAMTGSGSTVFGLFDSEPIAIKFDSSYTVKVLQL